ncbi:MAG TPA: DNA translocase FtsK [Candidatus Paceibacterota bacterium]|nr:DNA translocase FtsK [Candidatus Paceibacterota bacterium]
MAKRNGKNGRGKARNGGNGNGHDGGGGRGPEPRLHPDTKKSIWAIGFICVAVILVLAGFDAAGPAGESIYRGLDALFGWGYFILPATLLFAAAVLILSRERKVIGTTMIGGCLLVLSFLGLIEIFSPTKGGWLGLVLGSLRTPFGQVAAAVIDGFIFIISILITANVPLRIKWPERGGADGEDDEAELVVTGTEDEGPEKGMDENEAKAARSKKPAKETKDLEEVEVVEPHGDAKPRKMKAQVFANYVPPPLSLLKSDMGKPTTGDLLANANIIKRTLESFGITVDMGEINVGPAVTRYTLKPAEGVKLSRITALNPDLALSLAAHPIRIEAPIPGKSLVGIEVPNKAAALVRLGSLMHYPEFERSGPLGFVLGRDVSGEPIFASIEKMPHMLIAGATGSGKSILVHSILTSLLYKNSPQTLKLILIDPKRVELSIYDGIPHLVSPVITENKKALGVFRWAISEMERRYEVLQKAGSRDVKSYNAKHAGEDTLPYVVIAIDELADLMSSFGRDVEGSIVRLAQMARATGIHLLLATQRPSVEVITGLIKANIPARVALQVASQIDSRTILDGPGAEKLLGHGDLLFLSAELSKPKRIQGSFITEEEIKSVADFIRENNKPQGGGTEEPDFANGNGAGAPAAGGIAAPGDFDEYLEDEDSDEMLDEAIAVVAEAKKASASLLQRRLKVGYARAARLLDLMEAQGLIGPGEGAKPRDVNIEKIEERLS